MSGKRSRDKGQRGEREFALVLYELTGMNITRELGQARDGGTDLKLYGCPIEVKRAETLRAGPWLAQARRASLETGYPPVVAFRASRSPWRVLVELTPGELVDYLRWRHDDGLSRFREVDSSDS